MAVRTCRAPGCGARTSRYGKFCSTHRSRSRRHGHPEQRAITKADLAPYLRLVGARVAKNATSPVWAHCTDRWQAVVEHANRVLIAFERGQPGYRHERIAAREVIKLADHVSSTEVIETTFALFLLEDHQPRRFRSDASFRMQLARRLRGLTHLNAGTWYNHRTGKVQRAYRELTPRAALTFASWVIDALGAVGAALVRMEREEQEAKRCQANSLAEALEALN
ncbi:hypothetical protein CIW48_08135 [Methylobacterium sp. P1-11]|uniref:hypothetical protein n=1 Tax=Methylobacterium sp. P1-11 TaxID=2024616 RepID=UPI0011ECA74D|nr:hypothetical protein [Methylobacterium sp. P1-11]KAA0124287.1 hypothetical protein CIW48_08135 [Methylobacterium sp. P1-11]